MARQCVKSNDTGVEFDVCPTTGGVWLDKGELEKLIALVKQEARAGDDSGSRHRYDDYDDYDDDDDDRRRRRRGNRRSRLTDLFDF